ncbi:UNVERIFIED_CONTAM: hypothetical protein GTU68_046030 [Idotea baltica]|nr:hypothetical protein [Idotea baltica]
MTELSQLRQAVRSRYLQSEPQIVEELLNEVTLSTRERHMLTERAAEVVTALRTENNPSIMESFLGEYGLSTKEGVGLMCLAEALLRVPDPETIDELIADKIEPSDWGLHLGKSSSSLVNASTWALLLTGQILDDSAQESEHANPITALRQLVRRVGEPVVRTAVSQAMKMLGKQFVLGQTIGEALKEAQKLEKSGYTYSYDMLGEAARTHEDAQRYFEAYARAIEKIATVPGDEVAKRPGISIKLSALHPRYEYAQQDAVMRELLPRAQSLVDMAAKANIGLNIDAEEADRLDLSLDIIEALMENVTVPGWDGFGVVVQAYSRRALPVLDWLIDQCHTRKQRIMVRLVKGAYWDAEIKQAQELGLANFPVYTRKAHTDLSYIVCAQRLLDNRDVIYPQFATHNAHTVSAIRYLAGADSNSYEFQRLHGMGEALHQHILEKHGTRCRIYAPVGAHVDLLAYLVRRLLENGANSSFVNQIVNSELSATDVARCPIEETKSFTDTEHPAIKKPLALFSPERVNSKGFRINDPASIQTLLTARDQFKQTAWVAQPMLADDTHTTNTAQKNIINPATAHDIVGTVTEATTDDVDSAISQAKLSMTDWANTPVTDRSAALLKAADLYEENIAELCALVCREAGKHLSDGIAEVREAVDFLRYYAVEASNVDSQQAIKPARGLIACISPWNFPLAIFSGQLSAALVAGNAVIAKPAQQTPLVAARAVELLHQAGIPRHALQLLPGDGARIGNHLVNNEAIDGVCFTGSTGVAKHIESTLAQRTNKAVEAGADVNPMLIAETGGLNAMIADTTALTEQVVRDVVMSAFQSAGQRCSALRILYIQEEAQDRLLTMLSGALDTLIVADPWHLNTDIGPVIDTAALNKITKYIDNKEANGQLIKKISVPTEGTFCPPAIVRVSGIREMHEEIFGPVLHIASFKSEDLDKVIDDINASGYGLTFGLHTRIDDRVQHIVDRIHAGNIYVNRNQIGAVVGSQPFGGEGLSGTGPKAGGPHYLPRFFKPGLSCINARTATKDAPNIAELNDIQQVLDSLSIPTTTEKTSPDWLLPGPTGESNQLSARACGRVLVVANNAPACIALSTSALSAGCAVLAICSEQVNQSDLGQLEFTTDNSFVFQHSRFNSEHLSSLHNIDAVAFAGTVQNALKIRQNLSSREVPLIYR